MTSTASRPTPTRWPPRRATTSTTPASASACSTPRADRPPQGCTPRCLDRGARGGHGRHAGVGFGLPPRARAAPPVHRSPLPRRAPPAVAGGAADRGRRCRVDGRWDAEETLELILRHRVTHTHMVPTMFHRLLSLPPDVKERHDLSSLSFVVHGAAPCPVPVKQAIIDWWGPIVAEYTRPPRVRHGRAVGRLVATAGHASVTAETRTTSRPRRRGQPGGRGRGRHRLPDDLRERRVRAPPQGEARRGLEDAGRRDAGHRRSVGLRRPQAAAAVRRPTAASRARTGAGQPSARTPARRAARRARPQAPQGDAARAQEHPARDRHHVRARHARPGRGDDDGRLHRRDERRTDRAARNPDEL